MEWWVSQIAVTLLPGHTVFLSLSFPICKVDTQTPPHLPHGICFWVSCPERGKCGWGGWKLRGFGLQMSEGMECTREHRREGWGDVAASGLGHRHDSVLLSTCLTPCPADLLPCQCCVLWLEPYLLPAWSNRSGISQPFKTSLHSSGQSRVWFYHCLGIPCSTCFLLMRLNTVFKDRL